MERPGDLAQFCSSIYGATGVTSLKCCSSLYRATGATIWAHLALRVGGPGENILQFSATTFA